MQVVPETFPYFIFVKAAIGLLVAGAGALLLWPFRYARKEWKSLKETMNSTHSELVLQRENCLNTLQTQGQVQVDLLEKTVAALGDIKVELASQTGYLQASSGVPRTRRIKK